MASSSAVVTSSPLAQSPSSNNATGPTVSLDGATSQTVPTARNCVHSIGKSDAESTLSSAPVSAPHATTYGCSTVKTKHWLATPVTHSHRTACSRKAPLLSSSPLPDLVLLSYSPISWFSYGTIELLSSTHVI